MGRAAQKGRYAFDCEDRAEENLFRPYAMRDLGIDDAELATRQQVSYAKIPTRRDRLYEEHAVRALGCGENERLLEVTDPRRARCQPGQAE
jgi:hypothetical protein